MGLSRKESDANQTSQTSLQWRSITVASQTRLFKNVYRIECDEQESVILNISRSAQGNGISALEALMPGDKARILVEGKKIVGIGYPDPRMHPHTRQIMTAFGMNIDAVKNWATSALIWASSEDHVISCPEMGISIDNDQQMQLQIGCEDYTISHDDIYIRNQLPDTMIAACVGKLLREVISIPEIDHLEIPIIFAQNTMGGAEFTITDHNMLVSLV